jgi:hypothetical protein
MQELMMRRTITLPVLALAGAFSALPALGGEPDPFLVYVATLQADGSLANEKNLQCDARVACEVPVPIGKPDLDAVMVRVSAADASGVSVTAIGADGEGRLAIGRRRDVVWGPRGTLSTTIAARPLRPSAVEDDTSPMGVTMREDLPAVARIVLAVRDLRRPLRP